jgi:hypothetical protein
MASSILHIKLDGIIAEYRLAMAVPKKQCHLWRASTRVLAELTPG